MLQRLFSRGASRNRGDDTAGHSIESEQRDVLRERSAMILERLRRRQAGLRQAELDRRRSEADAIRHAAEVVAARRALEIDSATAESVEEAAPEGAYDWPEDSVTMEEARADHHAVQPADEDAVTADHAAADDHHVDETAGVAEADDYEFAEGTEVEAVSRGAPFEALDAAFRDEESEPDSVFDEDPRYQAAWSAPADDDTLAQMEDEAVHDEDFAEDGPIDDHAPDARGVASPSERIPAQAMFTESQPLRPVARAVEDSPGFFDSDGEHGEEFAPRRTGLADDDSETYALLRKKAEEAQARIAKRLKMLEAQQEGHDLPHLLDLGDSAPSLAPDDD